MAESEIGVMKNQPDANALGFLIAYNALMISAVSTTAELVGSVPRIGQELAVQLRLPLEMISDAALELVAVSITSFLVSTFLGFLALNRRTWPETGKGHLRRRFAMCILFSTIGTIPLLAGAITVLAYGSGSLGVVLSNAIRVIWRFF